jgi:opacity protein-like surface antigen
MIARNGTYVAVALSLSVLLTPEAQAQIMQPVTQNVGRGYVGGSAGIVIPSDLHTTFSGVVAGSGDFSFKAGGAGTAFIGYHFNDILAGEGELGVASADHDKFSGTLNGVTGSVPINGSLTTVLGLANVIVTPLGRSGFSPYVGGGIGFAAIDDTIGIGGVSATGRETDFAANLILGMDFAVANRWSVGARYRFVWINTASSASSGGITTSINDLTEHIITATATFHF